MFPPPDSFETSRLVLRKPGLADADDIFNHYAADPEVTRYLTWRACRDRGEVDVFLNQRLAKWTLAKSSPGR
jgi:RimJ/RimL family protein N-acetyltransferase